ncbi:hypothetical protein Q9L58_006083 [Maublancomyces gigas]|uniref:HNH nuclease domain-containing protein n=1 Tax=Discina gigas TaxID=1032678 RepID=A0ABR3GGD3_9PEZI
MFRRAKELTATTFISITQTSNLNRNVYFLDALGTELAGFFQNGSISYSDVRDFLLLLLMNDPSGYRLFRCSENGVPNDPLKNHGLPIIMLNNKLHVQPAYYIILSSAANPQPIKVQVTTRKAVARPQSLNLTPEDPVIRGFHDRVRARDGGCVVTGARVVSSYSGFQVAHLPTRAYRPPQLTDRHITIGESRIRSVQNGIMMFAHVRTAFDKYEFSINPDVCLSTPLLKLFSYLRFLQESYRITCFLPDVFGIDGRHIYSNPLAPADEQPLRELLRYHWQQAVLCNMKGRGAEYDYDLDTEGDVMGELGGMEGGKTVFEMMVVERLGNY